MLVLLVSFCFQFHNLNVDLKPYRINFSYFYYKPCILQTNEISNIGHLTAQEKCAAYTLGHIYSDQNVLQSALSQVAHRHNGC